MQHSTWVREAINTSCQHPHAAGFRCVCLCVLPRGCGVGACRMGACRLWRCAASYLVLAHAGLENVETRAHTYATRIAGGPFILL